MKLDRFTKAMLVVIAILLGALVFRPIGFSRRRSGRKLRRDIRSMSSRAIP